MQTMQASGARKNSQLRKTAAVCSPCPVDRFPSPRRLAHPARSKVLERSWQRRNFGRPTFRLFGQGGDEAVPACSGYEINLPRLDVGVRRRALRQGQGLIH